MAGESGAHGEVGGFFVANFTDDEGLGVLTQQVARGFGEIKADGFIDFRLHDAVHDLFNGVFDGDDVATVLFGEIAEARVDRGGFPAASGAGEQHQARGLAEKSGDLNARGFRQSEFAERFNGGGIEQAQDNFFSRHRRITRHSDVVRAADVGVFDAPILRQ